MILNWVEKGGLNIIYPEIRAGIWIKNSSVFWQRVPVIKHQVFAEAVWSHTTAIQLFTVNLDCMSQRYRKDNDLPVWWDDVPLGKELLGSCLCFDTCSIIHRRWEQTEHVRQCWGGEQWGFGFTLWQENEGIATWELVFCLTAFIPQPLKRRFATLLS